ncbi:MAG: hypothetical protein M3R52_12105 [Acidobacteriota bacterium]|nr:hypothetical protein [Acidobacteriota bacterium]
MRNILIRLMLVVAVCCAATLSPRAQRLPETPLTNEAVVKLVRAGFKEKTVIAIIRNRPSSFNLDPDRLIELKRSGVSENVILAMLSQDESFAFTDDDWTNDSDFGRSSTRAIERNPQERPGGVDIFGGTEGSRGQTRSRGKNGSNQGETTTTGSATVRILRPTTEAGGAQQKLERTPTLNNESVIKLVEAGFSEGTIVKRIEDSPADFDLSKAKLDELRRRRVTEAIITAMTAAMSDESEPKQIAPAKTTKARGD